MENDTEGPGGGKGKKSTKGTSRLEPCEAAPRESRAHLINRGVASRKIEGMTPNPISVVEKPHERAYERSSQKRASSFSMLSKREEEHSVREKKKKSKTRIVETKPEGEKMEFIR